MNIEYWIKLVRFLFIAILLTTAGGLCFLLIRTITPQEEQVRIPLDQTPLFKTLAPATATKLESVLEKGPGKPSETFLGTWSQFRGDNRDGIAKDSVPIDLSSARSVWEIPVGDGYAAPAIRNGMVYLIDHDIPKARDVVRTLSPEDGKDIWRFSWPVSILSDHGVTRTIPAVTEKYCVGIGPKCHAFCVDAITGEKKWLIDMVERYGTKVPNWYAGQCALIEKGADGRETAILAPAGPAAMLVAIDCETGEERWRTINPYQWKMTHVSLVRMTLDDGVPTYIYCGSEGVFGINATNGRILWGTTAWKIVQATCPSPVVLPGNRIFFCGGYGAGSLLLQVKRTEKGYRTNVIKRLRESEFGSTQQTPICFKDHLWGIGRSARKFCCLDDNANVVWRSRTKTDFGDGPYIIADDKILTLNDNGLLTLAATNPEKWTPLAEKEVIQGHECWGPLALVDGRLFLRSLDKLVCLDIRKQQESK